jgi:hypothetical protein
MARKATPRKTKSTYGKNIPVGLSCPDNPRNVDVDSTFIGYGCTMDDAKNDFFRKLLNVAAQQLRCDGGCSEGLTCVAECLETAQVEGRLKLNRIQLPACKPSGVGWKCYLHERSTTSQVQFRCTCVPTTI